jgi:hypothetical protein
MKTYMEVVRMKNFPIALLLVICITSPLYAAQSTIIDADGYACMGTELSRKDTEKAAMADAKRKAAEQAVTYIKSETHAKNYELEKDMVDAYTRGTVKVLETKSSSWYKDPQIGDCYRVAIKAEVIPDAEGIKRAAQKRDRPEGLSFQVNYVYRPQGTGELRPIKKGDILQSGDHYKILFSPDKDSYVYIFQVDSAGAVFQLFPMKNFKGVALDNLNPVKRGKTYILPASGKAFILDKQAGLERIYFIASRERDTELEGLYAEVQKAQGRAAVKAEDSREKLQRIFTNDADNQHDASVKVAAKERTPADTQEKLNRHFKKRGVEGIATDAVVQVPWKESGNVFSVMGQKLENLGEDNIHVLEFVHQ